MRESGEAALTRSDYLTAIGLMASALAPICGCGASSGSHAVQPAAVIRVDGSDTMVNLAQAWAEDYHKVRLDVSVQVSGSGSGVGISALIDGVVDLANASRAMEPKEIQLAFTKHGIKPVEHTVALDALAIYVHKDNPLEKISLEELAEIYGEGGQITKWSQLGVQNSVCRSDQIIRIGRQTSSGTYHYFRESLVGKTRDFKLGSLDQSGSKDVVALVARTPCAIGYSGMGYRTDAVKWLALSRRKGEPAVTPSVRSAHDGSYPLARALHIYTLGEASVEAQAYIDWILSAAGQQIVEDFGYIPVPGSSQETPDGPRIDSAPAPQSDGQSDGRAPQ